MKSNRKGNLELRAKFKWKWLQSLDLIHSKNCYFPYVKGVATYNIYNVLNFKSNTIAKLWKYLIFRLQYGYIDKLVLDQINSYHTQNHK